MTAEEYLAGELKKYQYICYYPSSGTDLSNLDYFSSGRKPLNERLDANRSEETPTTNSDQQNDPDLFIHTDINFYQEFEAGKDFAADDCGLHGSFEVLEFRELPKIENPNRISDNYAFSGQCFEYKLRLRGSAKIKTLIYCLCENEFFAAQILLANDISVEYIWSRNWNGGQTYGTWLANVLHRLKTRKIYTDWLCIPGHRGEPRNRHVEAKYPELMMPSQIKLLRNNDVHWIDEGAHGWVEEFDVVSC